MTTNGSYGGNEKMQGISDIEYAIDPASGGFFHSDYKKFVYVYIIEKKINKQL